MLNSTVIAALISAIVALVAVKTTMRSWQEEKRRQSLKLRDEAKLNHIKCQLSELYGPLYGYVIQHQAIVDLLKKVKMSNFYKENTNGKAKEISRFIREYYIYPIRAKQAELIITKAHLLKSKEIPKSFVSFLQHQVTGKCLFQFWKEFDVDTREIKSYPSDDFDAEVLDLFKNICEEYSELIKIQIQEVSDVRAAQKFPINFSPFRQSPNAMTGSDSSHERTG